MLHHLDITLFRLINNSFSSPVLDCIMPVISFATNRINLVILLGILFILGTRKVKITAMIAGIAFVISLVTVGLLKPAVARPRPAVVLSDVRILESNYSKDSFPSGHTAFSSAIAWVFGRRHRRIFLPSLTMAILVGFSRIYLGVHYPGDVFCGAVIGMAIGEICSSAFRFL